MFDVETTGLDPKADRIVEIGAVTFRNGRVTGSRSWLINPGVPVPRSAVRVHGITTDMVKDRPGFAAVFPEFRKFVGDAVLLAHNARYDISFVDAEIARCGAGAPPNAVVNTLPLFRQWFPLASRHTLAFMVEYLGLKPDAMHRGGSDAMTLYQVFKAGVATQASQLTLEDVVKMAGGELHFSNHSPAGSSPVRE